LSLLRHGSPYQIDPLSHPIRHETIRFKIVTIQRIIVGNNTRERTTCRSPGPTSGTAPPAGPARGRGRWPPWRSG
ncbi:MAG: hypothetical protein OXC19_03765, partial [Bryobacterales bacterium]|nr:hypothetical protein [Bryobacterales bacterium]